MKPGAWPLWAGSGGPVNGQPTRPAGNGGSQPGRLEFAHSIEADSVDGTKWARWPDTSMSQLQGLGYGQVGIAL